jgi:hypothetical protein
LKIIRSWDQLGGERGAGTVNRMESAEENTWERLLAINDAIPQSFKQFPYSIQNVDGKKPCIFYSMVLPAFTSLGGGNYGGGWFGALSFSTRRRCGWRCRGAKY